MSKSNSIVGSALSKCINMNGGNMRTEKAPSKLRSTFQDNFCWLYSGYSYTTMIAKLVKNESTGQHELWITPRYYSPTTQRHKSHYVRGFHAWCEANNQPFESNLYYTSVAEDVGGFVPRFNPITADFEIMRAETDIRKADMPRLRDATRRGTLDSGIHRLTQTLNLLTRNIPSTVFDGAPDSRVVIQQMRDIVDFMTQTRAIEDIGEMRAACRAYTTLSSN